MVARDRFAVELCRDQSVIIERIFESHISRVTIVTPEKNVTHFRFRFHDLGKGEESDPAPSAIKLAPGCDAVEIAYVFKLFERVEFFPGKRPRVFDEPAHFQSPICERDLGFDSEIENWKSLREMLAGRESSGRTRGRFRFSGHFTRPAFLTLDQSRVRRTHAEL